MKKTFQNWLGGNVFEHAAALAYGTLFAMAPTLMLTIAIAGMVFGTEAAEGRIFFQIKGLIGSDGANMVQEILKHAAFGGHNILATVLGGLFFLLGAGAVFAQLKGSLNDMWCVKPDPTRGDFSNWVQTQLLALAMVATFCFIMLVSLLLSAALAAFGDLISFYLQVPPFLLSFINFLLSTGIIALLFAMIFKVLPDVNLHWKDVWVGAGFTALLFAGGKYLIAYYIGNSGITNIYGAAGSIVLIMVWVYYTSLILFLGAAFTQAYASHRGRRLTPASYAVWTNKECLKE